MTARTVDRGALGDARVKSFEQITRQKARSIRDRSLLPPGDTLPRAEYARLLGIADIACLIVDGWDHGFPTSEGDSERDLIERLREALDASEAQS